jgi:hypothetical protein
MPFGQVSRTWYLDNIYMDQVQVLAQLTFIFSLESKYGNLLGQVDTNFTCKGTVAPKNDQKYLILGQIKSNIQQVAPLPSTHSPQRTPDQIHIFLSLLLSLERERE